MKSTNLIRSSVKNYSREIKREADEQKLRPSPSDKASNCYMLRQMRLDSDNNKYNNTLNALSMRCQWQ